MFFSRLGSKSWAQWSLSVRSHYKEITKGVIDSTRYQKACLYSVEKISIVIRRGNATNLLGTLPVDADVENF